jgi:hypothetical protein
MSNEDREAIAFVEAVQRAYPRLAHLLLHVKNERASAAVNPGAAAGQLKKQRRMGVRKGTADYFWAHTTEEPDGQRGLWLELKATGGSIKPEQVAFLRDMEEQGFSVAVAWGWSAALNAVHAYERQSIFGLVAYTPSGTGLLGDFTLTGTRRKRGQGIGTQVTGLEPNRQAAATAALSAVPRAAAGSRKRAVAGRVRAVPAKLEGI